MLKSFRSPVDVTRYKGRWRGFAIAELNRKIIFALCRDEWRIWVRSNSGDLDVWRR